MIEITYTRIDDTAIVEAKGHANYEEGVDRVCAAVSTLLDALAFQMYKYVSLGYLKEFNEEAGEGYHKLEMTGLSINRVDPRIVLDFITLTLKEIASQYPDNVSVSTLTL